MRVNNPCFLRIYIYISNVFDLLWVTWIILRLQKERIMQVLRNDISNVWSGELWICMKVSKAMFKKEKFYRGNNV